MISGDEHYMRHIEAQIEDTRNLSAGVDLADVMLTSIAISLKRIADYLTNQPETTP